MRTTKRYLECFPSSFGPSRSSHSSSTFTLYSLQNSGGTFALYSLLCRNARLGVLPNQQSSDETLSTYNLQGTRPETWQSVAIREFFRNHPRFRKGLLIVVLLGTSMMIGDGVLTPTISVLSAVSGIGVKATHLHENYTVAISCIILVLLFSLQHHGTNCVSFMFAPIVVAWLICIGSVGVYNIFYWNPRVFHAISPAYMIRFLKSTHREGWLSLGGVVLCITGSETMYANLGHFSPLSIKIAFTFMVYPCLILAYMGEAAFLSKHHEDLQRSFYKAIPEAVFWPVFIVATLAAIVGSQAVISATFSLVSQCCALSCFPRVKIIHTSSKIRGQVYIPEINWILMFLCLAITIGLRDTNILGHAYGSSLKHSPLQNSFSSTSVTTLLKFLFTGFAVTIVIFVTTMLMSLVIVLVLKETIVMAMIFLLFFGSIELLYISASLIKIPQGGWIPLVLSMIFMSIMYIWNYGTLRKYEHDMENKVPIQRILELGPGLGMVRVPGIGLIYADIVTGIPAVFGHFAANLPAFHQILVFVCVKSVQVPYIAEGERFLIDRIGPRECQIFRCILRYGYKDYHLEKDDRLENVLVSRIVEFVETEEAQAVPASSHCGMALEIWRAKEAGMVYIMGHSYAKAKGSSTMIKKFIVDVAYAFLSNNCRGAETIINVPHSTLLEVGMIYNV